MYLAKTKVRRAYLNDKVNELKNNPCTDCGIKYPSYVMQWDHLDPSTKVKGINELIRQSANWAMILKEINKCQLVCANCHAERTYASG